VVGIVGDSGGDIDDYVSNTFGDDDPPIRAAVLGVFAPGDNDQPPAIRFSHGRIFGFLAGYDPVKGQRAGVYGESVEQGVTGFGIGQGTGVYGVGNIGVRGEARDGTAAIQGRSSGRAPAGDFAGNVQVSGELTVQGQNLLALIRNLQQQVGQLQQKVSTLGMTDKGEPVVQPMQRPYIDAQVRTYTGGRQIIVTGSGFSPGDVIVRISDIGNGDEYGAGPVGLPYSSIQVPGNRVYHVCAQDTQTKDDNDLSGYVWSNIQRVQT
jgi:hypothetical protein